MLLASSLVDYTSCSELGESGVETERYFEQMGRLNGMKIKQNPPHSIGVGGAEEDGKDKSKNRLSRYQLRTTYSRLDHLILPFTDDGTGVTVGILNNDKEDSNSNKIKKGRYHSTAALEKQRLAMQVNE